MFASMGMPLVAKAHSGQDLDPFYLETVAFIQYGEATPGPLFVNLRIVFPGGVCHTSKI
jgi:hypothetical protein